MAVITRVTNKAIRMDITMINTMIRELVVSSNKTKASDGQEGMIRKKTQRRSAISP